MLTFPQNAFKAESDQNRDQTLKEAFQSFCVPAFQNLATKIGVAAMQQWIDTIAFGDRDISSGIDDFWLSREGKKSIRISPLEQARLISRLVNGEAPFSEKARAILKEVMLVRKTETGAFYGKTGSGMKINGDQKPLLAGLPVMSPAASAGIRLRVCCRAKMCMAVMRKRLSRRQSRSWG